MAEQYFGKYTGVVVDNRDAEQLGHVKVRVPAIYPDEEVLPARCALPYGFFFVPDVGTTVWVEFEGGDIGLPIWSAIQCVGGDWPKDGQVSPPTKRVIETPSGHVIVMNDTPSEEEIQIRDKFGNVIELANARITIRGVGAIEIQAPRVIINGRVVAPQPRPL